MVAANLLGSDSNCGQHRPVKLVSETVRERETFKYEPSLFNDFRFNSTGKLFDSSEIKSCQDSVLTAFSQLAAYQTGAERGFISLFDADFQYVIAEATPSMPLTPSLPSYECPSPLSLCGTAIPRSHGTCEHVLYILAAAEPNKPQDGVELPLSLVPDLATDSRFSSRPYCQFGEAGQFYAAVPIRTRRGINIGSLCVMGSTKEDFWTERCTQSLRGISRAITEHLEATRMTRAYRRNERMNRGLGSFIEGKATLSGWQSGPNIAAFEDDANLEGALDIKQQHLEREDGVRKHDENMRPATAPTPVADTTSNAFEGELIKGNNVDSFASKISLPSGQPRSHHSADPPGLKGSEHTEESQPGVAGTNLVFSKAANLIREAFEVAGCTFFDVTLGSYRTPEVQSSMKKNQVDERPAQLSASSSSDEQPPTSADVLPDDFCDILGFSTADSSSVNAAKFPASQGAMPKRFLAKLLRRYPNGKIFNFDAIGELESSDSSDDDGRLGTLTHERSLVATVDDNDGNTSTTTRRKQANKRLGRPREDALVLQAFPLARCVAFMPVWDSRRERWFAGGFVYTLAPTRIFTREGELSFLAAFTRLVATEIHNHETQQADQAKSDALGALSHELRSPLHGVILGTELLNDTDLTVFQGNATHTIETCCRTLLDTIDHLLDYSKINSFAAKHREGTNAASTKLRKRVRSNQFGKKSLYTNVRLDGLVEEVVEGLFAGFNFQSMSIRQGTRMSKSFYTGLGTAARHRLDSAQAMEQLSPTVQGEGKNQIQVWSILVYISVDPSCDWMFYLQAGAIRRIVMNLFGNSLKYTPNGAISISLSQEASSLKHIRSERIVKLIIHDTGKGISEDYLRHRLFKPFAQEDDFSIGTGLGLSLVHSIVTQLNGCINVASQVGEGTTVVVKLPLEQSPQTLELAEDDRVFEEQVRDLRGLRMRISGFKSRGHTGVADARVAVEDICGHSFGMIVLSEREDEQLTPDIVLWSDDALPSDFMKSALASKAPNVVVCEDALAAYELFTKYETAGQGDVFEFISQPIGPRKLAKSFQLAYKRWMGLPKGLMSFNRPAGPTRSRSSYGLPLATEIRTHNQGHTPTSTLNSQARGKTTSLVAGSFSDTQTTTAEEQTTDENQPSPTELNEGGITEKILLVDDNHINLKVLCAYMGKLGRVYEAATNGKEAVDAYMGNPGRFTGILMDISMPVMNGLEATRRIRAFEHKNMLPAVFILALTGLSSDDVHQEAFESGVDVFLTKPVRLKALSDVLESMNIISQPQVSGN